MRAFSQASSQLVIVIIWNTICLFCVKITVANDTKTVDSLGTEEDAKMFLARFNDDYSALLTKSTVARWNYNINLTDNNAALMEEVNSQVSAFEEEAYRRVSSFNTTGFDYNTKRLLSKVGSPSLKPKDERALSQTESEMARIYTSYQETNNGKTYSFEPDLKTIMESSIDASERLWAWRSWHDGVGRAIRPHYIKYVELKNRLARLRGYEDSGDELRQKYETKELEPIVLELYRQLEPLYKQLHAFIRRRLYQNYGPEVIDLRGPIPAHLLGDMWGRMWSGLNDIVQPYPDKTSVDPTPAMIQQNYTVQRMFELGDDFFQSMGLKPLPETFYNLSLIENPMDPKRKLICHPSAWDFYDGKDFRVLMCTRRIFEDFLTIHHELGHIQYHMQYAHLPVSYRKGANGGFHEAIGELMSMSVATTKHLRAIDLLESYENDPDVDINFLMTMSLRTVMSLPLHLILDTWRWKILKGEVPIQRWNREFWNQKLKVAGVIAPIPRDDALDLDPVALIHIIEHIPMINYFTRTILQFQFWEALCRAAGHTGPLYHCDIYNSTDAGTALAKMMQMGFSRPWPDALEALTGYREMSTQPLLNYFRPLQEWLEKENERNGEVIGWSE